MENGSDVTLEAGTGITLAEDTATSTITITGESGSDDQNIQGLALDAATNVLTVGIEDGTSQTVNLSGLVGSDDQNLTVTAGTATTSVIDMENGSDVTLEAGTGLTIAENTATSTITITGDSGSDDQTIDVFQVNGNNLELSLEDDAVATQTVALNDIVREPWKIESTTNPATSHNDNMYVLGNVGIGTNAPTYKLQVGATAGGDASDALINSVRVGRGNGDLVNNTAVGNVALYSNTTGFRQTAIGYQALLSNTTGRDNTAVGAQTLKLNTEGDFNIAMGSFALENNTAGDNNVALGQSALRNNDTGNFNVGIGTGVLANNTGNSNTALGGYALAANTVGQNNVGIGQGTLQANTTGSDNVAIGLHAGRYFIGLVNGVNPNQSIFIGREAKAQADNQTNQIVIGHQAQGIGSNTVVLGNNAIVTTALKGDVGVGTTIPTEKLDVDGTMRLRGQFYDENNEVGTPGQVLSTTATGTDWIAPYHDVGLLIAPRTMNISDGVSPAYFVVGREHDTLNFTSVVIHTFGGTGSYTLNLRRNGTIFHTVTISASGGLSQSVTSPSLALGDLIDATITSSNGGLQGLSLTLSAQ